MFAGKIIKIIISPIFYFSLSNFVLFGKNGNVFSKAGY